MTKYQFSMTNEWTCWSLVLGHWSFALSRFFFPVLMPRIIIHKLHPHFPLLQLLCVKLQLVHVARTWRRHRPERATGSPRLSSNTVHLSSLASICDNGTEQPGIYFPAKDCASAAPVPMNPLAPATTKNRNCLRGMSRSFLFETDGQAGFRRPYPATAGARVGAVRPAVEP